MLNKSKNRWLNILRPAPSSKDEPTRSLRSQIVSGPTEFQTTNDSAQSLPRSETLPKHIYLLWDKPQSEWPPVVNLCISLWRELNPDWTVEVLNGARLEAELLEDFAPEILAPMNIQMKADLLRLKLLSTQGGIWADATCIPLRPMQDWQDEIAQADFSAPGFSHLADGEPPRANGKDYGNWFLASQAGGYVATRLYVRHQAFFDRPRFPIPQDKLLNQHVLDNWRSFVSPAAKELAIFPYFTMHYLTALEIESDPTFRNQVTNSGMPRGVYNYIMSRMRNPDRSAVDVAKTVDFARKASVPVNKLNWKVSSKAPWDKIQKAVLDPKTT